MRWMSSTALPRSRFSRRAVTSAIGRRFSRSNSDRPARVDRRQRRRRQPAVPSVPRTIVRQTSGSKRCASGKRTRTGMVRSSSRRSVATSPSQAAESWLATSSDGEPDPSRGHGIDGPGRPRGRPRCSPTTSTTPCDLLEPSSASARPAPPAGSIVAEDLDLDRLRVALEIAEHVLQQLDELDLRVRHRRRQRVAQVGDDFFGGPAALAARLQPHQDVAAVLLRREHAELRSGAARVAGDLGRLREDRFDLLEARVGVFERAAGRRQVVDDEAAFVGGGQEAGADRHVGRQRQRPPSRTAISSASARALRAAAAASPRTPVEHAVPAWRGGLRRRAVRGARQQRNESQREHQRDQHRGRQRQRQRAEELADDAGEQPERREDHDRGQRRADERRDQLAASPLDRVRAAAFASRR